MTSGWTPGPESVEELLGAAVAFWLPLRVPFRGLTVREGMLIKGPSGWGEFAPFDDYDTDRSARWLAAGLEAAWGEWPPALRSSIEVNAIIPSVDATRAGVLTREAIWEQGCNTIKVKVGASLAEDEARVVAVRDALDSSNGDGRIRLDANGLWSLEQARTALRRLGRYGIEYVEQPCATLEDVARLRSEVDIPLAVDEVIRLASDPESVRLEGKADVAICKPMTVGGAHATVRIAERVGVPVVISGSLDSSIGLSACIAAAAALPDLPFASGLGTGALLARDVTDPPTRPKSGMLAVERTAPDLEALMQATKDVTDERANWWRNRLAEAYHALSSSLSPDSGGHDPATVTRKMEG